MPDDIDKSYLILFGMLCGFVSIYLGYLLFLKGIEGSSSLEGEVKKVKLTLRNASPGLFFALFGAFIIITGIYKPEIHSREVSNGRILETTSKGGKAPFSPALSSEFLEEAMAYRKSGDYKSAKMMYYLILQSNPSDHIARNNLANIYIAEKKFSSALEHAMKAIDGSSPSALQAAYYDTLSKIYFQTHDYRKSDQAILKAIELDPGNPAYISFSSEIKKKM